VALDYLPIPASSVPSERLFSSAKRTADDRRSRLLPSVFEEIVVLKTHWQGKIPDRAQLNSKHIEEVNEDLWLEFEQLARLDEEMMLDGDIEEMDWDAEEIIG
jgi:hypothetical protein